MSKPRSEIPEEKKWNVEAFYASPEQWKKDFNRARGAEAMPRWPHLKGFEGRLKESPETLAKFFDAYFDLDRALTKLYTYANLRADEDLGNDEMKLNFGLISSLYYDFQIEYSWVESEILSFKEEDYQRLLASDALKGYRFFLERLGRLRPHTLPQEQEALLALGGKALEASSKAFGALNNADMRFEPAVTGSGEKKELSHGSYFLYLRSSDRALRKSAFEHVHKAFETHANTLCELIHGHVQSHLFLAKAKKYKDCREAALYPQNIDPAVYDALIQTVHEYLPAVHEYVSFRKELLELDEIHPYDLYVPLVEEIQLEIDYEEARREVAASVEPLGREYAGIVAKGLYEDRWVDPFENLRKRSGGYSSPCYDSMPYILMNYHGAMNDAFTLAHEVGHSMHSFLSHQHQPYVYFSYPIFVAEVASTFNEQLLLQRLKSRAKSKQELAYLLNYEIEAIRTTIIRQTLFAEFELQMHRFVEEGIPLTPSLLKKTYLDINRAYYGPDLVLDGGLEVEWSRIPHFYSNFYVYQYATGLSAALALFEKARSKEAVQRYLQFLSSGGSDYPLELLKRAGVDLTSRQPVEAAMKRFQTLLRELKETLGKKGLKKKAHHGNYR